MHLDNTIPDLFVFAPLYPAKYFDCDPLLLTLHKSCHDFGDSILIKRLGLDIVDVFFIILASLLLARSLGYCSVPPITVVDAESLDGTGRELSSTLSLRLATNVARTIGLAAVAGLWICSIAVDVVVEDKFFACLDFALGKNSHAQFVANHPLVDIAVGIT